MFNRFGGDNFERAAQRRQQSQQMPQSQQAPQMPQSQYAGVSPMQAYQNSYQPQLAFGDPYNSAGMGAFSLPGQGMDKAMQFMLNRIPGYQSPGSMPVTPGINPIGAGGGIDPRFLFPMIRGLI